MAKYLVLRIKLFASQEEIQAAVTDSLNELLNELVLDVLIDDGWSYSIEEGD